MRTKSGQDFQNVPRGDHFGSWCRSLVVISSRSLGWTEVSSGGSKRKCHHCSVVFRVPCECCQGDLLPGCPPRSPLYRTASRQCYAHRFFQHGYVTASRLSECCVLWTLTWPKAHSNPKAPQSGSPANVTAVPGRLQSSGCSWMGDPISERHHEEECYRLWHQHV